MLPWFLMVAPAFYSHLALNYDFSYFSLYKSIHPTENPKTMLRTYSPEFRPQSKLEANRSRVQVLIEQKKTEYNLYNIDKPILNQD